MCAPPTRKHHFFNFSCVSHFRHTFLDQQKHRFSPSPQVQPRLKTLQNALYTLHFWKKTVISFERGDIDVRPSCTKLILVFDFFECITIWPTFLATIMYGSKGKHRIPKLLKMISWSLMTIEIIKFTMDIGYPNSRRLVVSGRRWKPWQAYPYSCKLFNWVHAHHIDGGMWGNGITYDMGERVRKYFQTEVDSVTYDMGRRVGL